MEDDGGWSVLGAKGIHPRSELGRAEKCGGGKAIDVCLSSIVDENQAQRQHVSPVRSLAGAGDKNNSLSEIQGGSRAFDLRILASWPASVPPKAN